MRPTQRTRSVHGVFPSRTGDGPGHLQTRHGNASCRVTSTPRPAGCRGCAPQGQRTAWIWSPIRRRRCRFLVRKHTRHPHRPHGNTIGLHFHCGSRGRGSFTTRSRATARPSPPSHHLPTDKSARLPDHSLLSSTGCGAAGSCASPATPGANTSVGPAANGAAATAAGQLSSAREVGAATDRRLRTAAAPASLAGTSRRAVRATHEHGAPLSVSRPPATSAAAEPPARRSAPTTPTTVATSRGRSPSSDVVRGSVRVGGARREGGVLHELRVLGACGVETLGKGRIGDSHRSVGAAGDAGSGVATRGGLAATVGR